MNRPAEEIVTTRSAEETRALAERLAGRLPRSCVLALHGELGAGKTCLVQGLAAGLGVEAFVNSPTFTLIQEYPGARKLFHIDLYRIRNAAEALGLGLEEYLQPDGVTAIEWAERAEALLPDTAWHIHLEPGPGPEQRIIRIRPGGSP
jgi:tRNA threonylcarbamoyladenosine biosynthesis protein TsaE